ncbi:MAG: alpha/beta hydrolase [Lachnospiraceae bacterium]|nr:alpha/beta hydrolase [Lachnospiraceae bacterium]
MVYLFVIVLLVAYVLTISYVSYRIAFQAPKRREGDGPPTPGGPQYPQYKETIDRCIWEIMDRPYESVSISSFDGLKLSGRYYHVADGAPFQIQFHGYKSSGYVDFCGGTKLAIKLGYNVLVVDQRSHGKSEGKTITFGVKERRDCLGWIDYVLQRFGQDTKIVLAGISMGAATVLMASQEKLPANVKGIMADCPYSSPKEIICKVGRELHFPLILLYPFIKLGARVFGGFALEESSAVEAVKNAKVPILLIHGEADGFVPCEMSHAIKATGGDIVELHTFPEATHGMSYMVDAKRYEEITINFLERIMNGENRT